MKMNWEQFVEKLAKGIKEEKEETKYLYFGKKKPAIISEGYELRKDKVEEDLFLLHQLEYRVTIIRNESGRYEDDEEIRRFVKVLKRWSGLRKCSIDNKRSNGRKYRINLQGVGLLPKNIHQIFFQRAIIDKIEILGIELKCFPASDLIYPSETFLELSGYKLTKPPTSTSYSKKNVDWCIEILPDMKLTAYEIDKRHSWGKNLELSLKCKCPETDFKYLVSEMYYKLTNLPFVFADFLTPISKVKSPKGYRACGNIITQGRNCETPKLIRQQAKGIISREGEIEKKELYRLCDYNTCRQQKYALASMIITDNQLIEVPTSEGVILRRK